MTNDRTGNRTRVSSHENELQVIEDIYINTCEVYELETLLSCLPADWWKSFAIELINKSGWHQYLEVKPEQVRDAIGGVIDMIKP